MDAFTHQHVSEGNSGSQNLDTDFAGARIWEVFLDKFETALPIHDDAFVLHVREASFNVVDLQEANTFASGLLLVRMEAEAIRGLPPPAESRPGRIGETPPKRLTDVCSLDAPQSK
jgi:hypothetical protein